MFRSIGRQRYTKDTERTESTEKKIVGATSVANERRTASAFGAFGGYCSSTVQHDEPHAS
jgi:hypothetical protein